MFTNPNKELVLPTENLCLNCEDVNIYEKLNRLGEGTYGVVYRARHSKTGEIVALKKVILEGNSRDGLPISSQREVSLLRRLNHENIVQVQDIVVGSGNLESIFMVMEYCEHDMAFLMDNVISKNVEKQFTPSQIKCLFHQLLSGVDYLHRNYVIHRDLKMSNLLLKNDGNTRVLIVGTLKIADFGLARRFKREMTPKVVTLWYRSPELLLGASKYTSKIDMWSVGCIFAELLLSKPLFPAQNEQHLMQLIVALLGSPHKVWPAHSKLPVQLKIPLQDYSNMSEVFAFVSPGTRDMLMALLVYDPDKRSDCYDAFNSLYFKEQPRMCDKKLLPSFPEHRNNRMS